MKKIPPTLLTLLVLLVQPALAQPHFDLPKYAVNHGSGNFTGFNSVDLQKIYRIQNQPAIRSQISPPSGQKPCLGRLPNGDLLATQIYQGAIALCRSRDDGLSWSRPRLVRVSKRHVLPGRAPMFSALKDGTLLLAHRGVMYRSTDEGQTWTTSRIDMTVTDRGLNRKSHWGENSGPHELSNGTVICCSYINVVPGHGRAYLYRSNDRGRTWSQPTMIADYCSEVNLVVLPGDRLFGCLRQGTRLGKKWAGEGGVILSVASSNDGGRTWTKPRKILGKAQSPGFPIRLKDGRLIIVYTHRQSPHGIQAIASLDDGKTWDVDHPAIIAWNSFDAYCGHPRSIVLPDNSIVSGFYVRAFHSRRTPTPDVVGHCVRWRAPDNWPAKWPPKQGGMRAPKNRSPHLQLPTVSAHRLYSGYNSLNLQEIHFAEKQPVVRRQIGPRGGGEPAITQLNDGTILATQTVGQVVCLSRSSDHGATWSRPRPCVVATTMRPLRGTARHLGAVGPRTLILATTNRLYRSGDQGRTWQACRLNRSLQQLGGRAFPLRFASTSGATPLSDGTIVCTAYASSAGVRMAVDIARDGQDGKWSEKAITWNNAPRGYRPLGTFWDDERSPGYVVKFSSKQLVEALNSDTNDILDLRLFASQETKARRPRYYATKENRSFQPPQLIVVTRSQGRRRVVVLTPSDDALTRGGPHANQNNETGPHLDRFRMWISGPNNPPGEQQYGYLKFNLRRIQGQVISATLQLTKVRTHGVKREDRAYLLRSSDGGQSWSSSMIGPGRETNLTVLPNGELLGCITLAEQHGPGSVGLTRSRNGGRTWSKVEPIKGLGSAQVPGYPLSLGGDRVLLVYGNRQFPFGVQAILSHDGGQTWDVRRRWVLSWFSWDHHCGNPRSVLIRGRQPKILTAYYARVFSAAPDRIVHTPSDRDPHPDIVAHSVLWEVR